MRPLTPHVRGREVRWCPVKLRYHVRDGERILHTDGSVCMHAKPELVA